MQKWEYAICEESNIAELREKSTSLGKQGWEVVGFSTTIATASMGFTFTESYVVVLKHPKP